MKKAKKSIIRFPKPRIEFVKAGYLDDHPSSCKYLIFSEHIMNDT